MSDLSRNSGADDRAPKRPPPFSVRLSEDERARLMAAAGGVPLGTYIKAAALGGTAPRRRSSPFAVQDRRAFSEALALLGQSRLASNLNQLARAANIGSLPLTPETEADLKEALRAVQSLRALLLAGLGYRPEDAP